MQTTSTDQVHCTRLHARTVVQSCSYAPTSEKMPNYAPNFQPPHYDNNYAGIIRRCLVISPGNRLVRTMCMYGAHVMKTLRQKEKYNAKAELDPVSQHMVVITKGKMNFFSKNLLSFPFVQSLFYFRFCTMSLNSSSPSTRKRKITGYIADKVKRLSCLSKRKNGLIRAVSFLYPLPCCTLRIFT